MYIRGYGIASGYSGYGVLSNKPKTPSSVFTATPAEKQKTESKNSNANNNYDPSKNTAKTGSISLPSDVYTKTEPTRSDEEILKDVAELAKKHAEKGTFHYKDEEYLSLMEEYISSVSPDRESILENTMNEINEKIKVSNSKKNGEGEEKENFDTIGTLLQVLKNMEKGRNEITSDSDEASRNGTAIGGQFTYNMYGDTYEAYTEDGELKDVVIHESNGKTLMYLDDRNSSGKLSVRQAWTDEEIIRDRKITEVYNETYMSTSSSKGLISGNAFDTVC
jgi:hypothetical protein